ncbi:RagB/SusD family nutrient uptake outer membrane protein [Dysgonomonas sp. Marseille-P4677]|uniref:RagB/SusD family nutrient uptake outer membrane protein n=1 Tax=Dysgonomonas sp. Marseille-P4677 TaxID=2364790 RepID=UPI0019117D70|nr:RagB/SusD family nutrient uptake outer membrane protein [Dysgonomonas sp. Marseille-P4677]MBK5722711.1 RagB/SusD family nutrient uptake outer membrane protein [Dysgonomonas sp. Marseille-P4677]
MKKFKLYILIVMLVLFATGCSDFLDREPDQLLSDDAVFSDPNMVQSVLANLYGRVEWGQSLTNNMDYIYLDEACKSDGGPDQTRSFPNDRWRVYDYTIIRNINQFLISVSQSGLDVKSKLELEGEARFLRAWIYFNMARSLGGMPIVEDVVFEYTAGADIEPLRYSRSTEEAIYDYIISECDAIINGQMLTEEKTVNAAKANKWAVLTLKAKAAIYAASIAKYNNLMPSPIRTTGGEVGIPASRVEDYYRKALNAAEEVIKGKKYELQKRNPDKGINFYQAVTVKDNNLEVIWAVDYIYPGLTHQFTTVNTPTSVSEDMDGNAMTPILNLVEAFEYKDNRNGEIRTKEPGGEYVFYDKPSDAFENKDARLYGTIIYPGSVFRGKTINYQAGRKYLKDNKWVNEVGQPGSVDSNGNIITSENGPVENSESFLNKSGFNIRKFLDEMPSSGTRGRGSDVWFVRFRYADILLMAAEAAMELNDIPKALPYINEVRDRAGIQPLQTVSLDDIVRERRVEFAFENQRFWDLKRWRLAHVIWDGEDNMNAMQYVLFPYVINQPGHPAHGKWVFDKKKAYMAPYPRNFELNNYYNYLDQKWLDNNPKLVKNPYQ